jgi:hypothetical protein
VTRRLPGVRAAAAVSLAAALLGPSAAIGQETLDPIPILIHGVAFGAEQTLEGDYTVDIQTSAFHPAGAPKGQDAWLEGWTSRRGDDGGIVRRYHIRFVGRHTVAPGRYGPGGAYADEVVIDKLISARLLIGGG